MTCTKNSSRVWPNIKKVLKVACWQLPIFRKMTNFVKMANLATIHLRFAKIQMRWPTRHVDRWRFLQKWQIWWKWRIWGVINEWLAKNLNEMAKNGLFIITGFIQKIATIFQGLFKDFSRTTLDFQGQPTRNIISQIVQKCIFPVYSNKTLRL